MLEMNGETVQVHKRCILKKIGVPFTLVAAILFCVLCKDEPNAKIIDKIVAVVNDDIITLSEHKEITVA